MTRIGRVLLAAALLAASAAAWAQTYPAKAIRLIVPFPPGGPADAVARPLAQKLMEALGEPVVVENRAGATGTIGASFVAKAPPDGYTLLLGTSNELTMSPGLYATLPYDPGRDFAPISAVILFPNLLVVHPALPVESAQQLVALARSRREPLTFGTSGSGSTNHLTTEVFRAATGIAVNYVAYKGGGPAMTDLMGGHIEAMFATMPSAVTFVKSGKLRGLMVTDERRWAALPEVPSAREAGLPSVRVISWNGVLAPAGTPAAIVQTLNAAIVKIMGTQDMKDRMAQQAAEATSTTPEQFAQTLRRDFAQWLRIVKATGARADN